jgi:hypothetical protein
MQGHLLDAVHECRLRKAGHIEDGGGDVDDVVELRAHLATGLEALRPVDDGPVPRSSEVRGDLLRPLVGGVHGEGPTHRIVVVSLGRPEVVDRPLASRLIQICGPTDASVLDISTALTDLSSMLRSRSTPSRL